MLNQNFNYRINAKRKLFIIKHDTTIIHQHNYMKLLLGHSVSNQPKKHLLTPCHLKV